MTSLPPVEHSSLWLADIKVLAPNFAGKIDIESPTRSTHSWAVGQLEQRIAVRLRGAGYGVSEIGQELTEKKAFFDNDQQLFGTVNFASGYTRRTPDNGRLNWALIKPRSDALSRIGKNELANDREWVMARYQSADSPWAAPLEDEPRPLLTKPLPTGVKDLSNGDKFWKIGSATGQTGGAFSSMKSDVRMQEADMERVREYMDKVMLGRSYLFTEYLFYGIRNLRDPSSQQGNSGSVVFDKDGNAVGLFL